jgi:hypothetical protein
LNLWPIYKLKFTGYKAEHQGKPLVVYGAGFRSGNTLIDVMAKAAQQSWFTQDAQDQEAVNAIVMVSIPRNDEEALVSVMFNPKTGFNENNKLALEMDSIVKAVDYLKGVAANKMRSDVRAKQAVTYIGQEKNKEITWN